LTSMSCPKYSKELFSWHIKLVVMLEQVVTLL
jgi:hypothetical protein